MPLFRLNCVGHLEWGSSLTCHLLQVGLWEAVALPNCGPSPDSPPVQRGKITLFPREIQHTAIFGGEPTVALWCFGDTHVRNRWLSRRAYSRGTRDPPDFSHLPLMGVGSMPDEPSFCNVDVVEGLSGDTYSAYSRGL